MSTPTATPRTDAALEWVRPAGNDSGPPNEQYVCADVARTLETELAEAKAEAAHYMSVAQKATDDLARLRADNLTAHQMACAAGLERDQLRAEVKRWQAEAEEMSAQRSHNANQAGRLRAEVERLRSDRDCEKRLRKDADEFRENAIARAERAEADTARLNWLAVSDVWFDFPATGAFTPETMRAAIDAAMKGTT